MNVKRIKRHLYYGGENKEEDLESIISFYSEISSVYSKNDNSYSKSDIE